MSEPSRPHPWREPTVDSMASAGPSGSANRQTEGCVAETDKVGQCSQVLVKYKPELPSVPTVECIFCIRRDYQVSRVELEVQGRP